MNDHAPNSDEMALRRHECDDRGHAYEVLGAATANVPMEVVCIWCEERWEIRHDEPARVVVYLAWTLDGQEPAPIGHKWAFASLEAAQRAAQQRAAPTDEAREWKYEPGDDRGEARWEYGSSYSVTQEWVQPELPDHPDPTYGAT